MNKKTLFIIIILVVILAGGFLLFNKNKTTNNSKDNPTAPTETPANSQVSQNEQNNTEFEISELGIKFPTKDSVAEDLVYVYKKYDSNSKYPTGSGVSFSLKSMEGKGDFCNAESAPLGGLTEINGQYKKGDSNYGCLGGMFIKQFDNFFICYYGPQADNGCFGDLTKTTGLNVRDYINLDNIEKM